MTKNKIYISPKIEVRHSKIHGLGVFTKKKIFKGELIEEAPVLLLKTPEKHLGVLMNYVFEYSKSKKDVLTSVIALGYGSLYNHNHNPNIHYTLVKRAKTMQYTAECDIAAGSELFIDYGGDEYWACRDKKPKL